MAARRTKSADHSTITRFSTGFLADACEDLFYQMVKRLEKNGELSKEIVFIDGTKLEACANKYTFVWKKSVGKWEAKMYGRIQEAVSLLKQEYICDFRVAEEKRSAVSWRRGAKRMGQLSYMEEGNAKAGIKDIWNCFNASRNARQSMTGTQPAFRDGIITVRQIRTLHSCT